MKKKPTLKEDHKSIFRSIKLLSGGFSPNVFDFIAVYLLKQEL